MRTLAPRALVFVASVPISLLALPGCEPEGCLDGEPGCVMPSPCEGLAFTCEGGAVSISMVESAADVPGGLAAIGAVGDFRLANDQVVAIIDALDHPHHIAPGGGSLIDLSLVGADNESLRQVFQVTGVLPEDAALYTSSAIFEGEGFAAVQFMGTLDGRPDLRIATRYEVRPCEPGVRVRTEVINLEPDPVAWTLADGWYWGGRELMAFAPTAGAGFDYPSFGLSDLPTAYRDVPYFVAGGHTEPAASYTCVPCNYPGLSGFHSEDVSAAGTPPTLIQSRDYLVFERFVGITDGPDVGAGADLALELRRQLHEEPYVVLSGAVSIDGADGTDIGAGLRASVLVEEGTPDQGKEERIPRTHALVQTDGSWSVRVPRERDYVLTVEAFGQDVASSTVSVEQADLTAPAMTLPAVGLLTIDGTVDGVQDHLLAFVVPADDATEEAVTGRLRGAVFEECAPLLGMPHGPSPACNRVLVDGPVTVAVPPGNYEVLSTAGLFSTLARQEVTIASGSDEAVTLAVRTLEVKPDRTLSADFHVHGAGSWDASIPHEDRVAAWLASRTDVIASTEHDSVNEYGEALEALGVTDELRVIVGMETTGHLLQKLLPDAEFPQVVGHWNIWPLEYDPEGPYRGGFWDEKAQPGEMFTRAVEVGWPADTGVIQLNHPTSSLDFGRDTGWARTVGIKLNEPLPERFDGTPPSLFVHQPPGADFRNDAYHVQEVMNGTNNGTLQTYRAFWHYLLNQGVVRAGTANSDSHSLTENVMGAPATLVYTAVTKDNWNEESFNSSVRAGHMIGTLGPVVQVSTTDAQGGVRGPALASFEPAADAVLDITVDAAPWVPVTEVRIVVNGAVAQTITEGISEPPDNFGSVGVRRLQTSVPLADVLPASGDAWVVIEAGTPLEPNADLDCDGYPDTGDNNRDGTIDWRDVEGLTEAPEGDCLEDSGPLTDPPAPARGTALHYFTSVMPGGYPMAFTNPLILDRDGTPGFVGVPGGGL